MDFNSDSAPFAESLRYLQFSIGKAKGVLNRSLSSLAAVLFIAGLGVYAGDVASTTGTVFGVTRDAAGRPLGHVQVTFHNAEENSDRAAVSDADGAFVLDNLKPGHYRATAQKEGFAFVQGSDLDVKGGQILAVNPAVGVEISKAPEASEVARELAAMKERIEELEAKLRAAQKPDPVAVAASAPAAAPVSPAPATPAVKLEASVRKPQELPLLASLVWPDARLNLPSRTETALSLPPIPGGAAASAPTASESQDTQAPPAAAPAPAAPPAVNTQDPFAFGDFTWMNAVPRNHDSVFDGKYFTGEFRWDSNYIYDYNHPIDHTLAGTTEGTQTGEFVVQDVNIGGDFHWEGVQARFLTQIGADATAVPRNDASPSLTAWDIADAYRYVTEAYGGYHLNVQHGLNIQAGIFMSYIGLFSYYSFDNWSYQPSYVSSNTPWFFNGMRIQWFPTNKLKFEPWLINGWQSYGKYNGRMGVGGQILWRPTENLDFVFNSYGAGQDTVYTHRTRMHEDDSMEWKYWQNPNKLMHRMAFSFTFDIGCETGGGTVVEAGATPAGKVVCTHGSAAAPAQNFVGAMVYHRWWFGHDKFGATVGGGYMSNPGRYLVLLPPINGATAASGTPYFTTNPGQQFKAYDFQTTFDWMPTQFVTWRVEFTQRGSDVPYFVGPGGITPPGGNTGSPGSVVPGWSPDLVKQERRWIFALMVRL